MLSVKVTLAKSWSSASAHILAKVVGVARYSRTLLTAIEIPPSGYGHWRTTVYWRLLRGKLRATRRVDGEYGERTATVSTRLAVDRPAAKLKTSG